MPFERSVWVDVSAMVLCALAAYADWRAVPELLPIAVPRWEVFRTLPAEPQVRIERAYAEDTRPEVELGAIVSRDTSGGIPRGTFCILSARVDVDDLREASQSSHPWHCSLELACGSDRPLAVSYAECHVSRTTGRAAAKAPYMLSSHDEWGTCNHRTSFVIDGARGTITLDETDLENMSKPERDTLELAIVGGVADP